MKHILIVGGIAVFVGIVLRSTLSSLPGFKQVYLAVNPAGVNAANTTTGA